MRFAGTVLPGVTSPDWRPWKDRGAERTPPHRRAIVDYPGPPRERYCDRCKVRVLTGIWATGNRDGGALRYGTCPQCQDVPITSGRYDRLKKFGIREAPYRHSPVPPATGPPLPCEDQKLLTDFVKVRKTGGRKKNEAARPRTLGP